MILRFIRAVYYLPFAVVFTFGISAAIVVLHHIRKLLGKPDDGRFEHRIGLIWGKTLIRANPVWSVVVEGREHLPDRRDGPGYVIVANHESMADIFALCFLDAEFRWLGKASMFKIPLVGAAMRCTGYIPVDRGSKQSHIEALEACDATVKRGIPVVFFPEGTRSLDGVIRSFKLGAFKVAIDNRVDVLPIALLGTSKMLPKGSLLPGRAQVRVKVLPLVRAGEDESVESFGGRVRAAIVEAHAGLAGNNMSGHKD